MRAKELNDGRPIEAVYTTKSGKETSRLYMAVLCDNHVALSLYESLAYGGVHHPYERTSLADFERLKSSEGTKWGRGTLRLIPWRTAYGYENG